MYSLKTVAGLKAAGLAGGLLLAVCGGACGAEPAAAGGEVALTGENFLAEMAPGWNLGNTLEAINGSGGPFGVSQETLWGNPAADQELMDSVRAAGFKSIRIPVAWNQYAGPDNVIKPFWMKRVTEVVDAALKAGLVVMINVHWDGGWLQPVQSNRVAANARLAAFWTQIATNFKDYDDHLLFAGTNEIMVKDVYSAPTPENCSVQSGFNQTFVNAVRATGGKNATRWLVVQGYNTNIDHTQLCNAVMPADSAVKRLMMEVHYYDPYDFTLNTDGAIWQWGAIAKDAAHTQTWANEAYTDGQFQKMKANFVDKGVPVILGEYAASVRTEYDAAGTYRTYWDRYVTESAVKHGMVPMYWDNGVTSNHSSGLFNRDSGKAAFPEVIKAIVEATQ